MSMPLTKAKPHTAQQARHYLSPVNLLLRQQCCGAELWGRGSELAYNVEASHADKCALKDLLFDSEDFQYHETCDAHSRHGRRRPPEALGLRDTLPHGTGGA